MLAVAMGVAVLGAAWLIGPTEGSGRTFSAHMTRHMAVVAVAAPLLAFGTAGGRFDPARRWPAAFPPVPASLAELVVVWAWHAPALHHMARHSPPGFVLEQASFLASGLVVWWSAFGGAARGRSARAGAGVLALLLTSMHMTLLGALLALTPRPLYAHAPAVPDLTLLEDQHLGGAIMILVGGLSYLAGGLWLSAQLLAGRRAEPAVGGRS
jgi:putative membrane protein